MYLINSFCLQTATISTLPLDGFQNLVHAIYMALTSENTEIVAQYAKEDRSSLVEGIAFAFLAMEIGIVMMRFVSRGLIKARLRMDDYLVFPSLLFCTGMCILSIGMPTFL